MKISRIAPVILALLALAALGGLTPQAHAPSYSGVKWLNPTFVGSDPYYGGSYVNAFTQAQATATLSVTITNFEFSLPVKVVWAQVGMDWGTNYTNTGISNSSPKTIPAGGQASITIPVDVSTSSPASLLVDHVVVPSWSYFKYNYTITSTSGGTTTSTTYQCPYVSGPFPPMGCPGSTYFGSSVAPIVVYSADQAAAHAALTQLQTGSGSTVFSGLALGFTPPPQASSLLAQAQQQYNIGLNLYTIGNFTAAKTDLQNAVSLWNQAISADNSHGNTLESNAMVGNYGSLLLGIGAIVGAVGAIIYAVRRPKMLSASATHQTPT